MPTDISQAPGTPGLVSNVQTSPNDMGYAGNLFKKRLKMSARGVDIGQYGELAPINEAYGAESAEAQDKVNNNIELQDQPVLRERMANLASQRVMQGRGQALAGGLADLEKNWAGGYQTAHDNYLDRELKKRLGAGELNAQSTHYYDHASAWQSLLGAAIGGASEVGASFAAPGG